MVHKSSEKRNAPESAGGSPERKRATDHMPSRDMLLELTFVPQWARQSPGENPYGRHAEEPRREKRPPPRAERRRRESPPRGKKERKRKEPGTKSAPRARPGHRAPAEQAEPPIAISFIPERNHLGRVVRELHETKRAYRLVDLAHYFLARPAHHAVKVEVTKQANGRDCRLYQCKGTGAIFLDRNAAVAHAKATQFDAFYDVEEVEGEPPQGQFQVVARCTLSGTLLGPPNHHRYAERVAEMHRERFSHMTLDKYRNHIETVRDPALIEQWKESERKRRLYRPKGTDEPRPELDRLGAEAHFLRAHAPSLIVEGKRFIAPANALLESNNPLVQTALRRAWHRESRRPFTLLHALRPALRHMRVHFFRANGRSVFVTAVKPHPLSPKQTINPISEVLSYLRAHPGCTRQELIEGLRPGRPPESSEVSEVLNPLRWLIERGHVIEFSNGTLSVPTGTRQDAGAGKDRADAPSDRPS